MRRFPLVVLIVLVCLVGGRYLYGVLNPPSDAKLIQEALQEAITASKEGRPGGVLDKLSDTFKVNSQEPGQRNVADFVKKSHPDITLSNSTPVIEGDTATITSDVAISVEFLNQKQSFNAPGVKMVFKKEDARDWLIFPGKKWHLSDVTLPENAIPGGMLP
jgi:hypothetical protein